MSAPELRGDETPEVLLNASLWRATQAVLDAWNEAAGLDLSDAEAWELAEERGQVAALPTLAPLLSHPKLHQTVARAIGAEAARLVRVMRAEGQI